MNAKRYVLTCVTCLAISVANAMVNPPIPRIKKKEILPVYTVAELQKNLEFDFAKASIRNKYSDRLDQLAKTIIDKNGAVALRGYADARGTFKANWKMSEKRDSVVKAYLINKGVPEAKIITTAFGSTNPIASNKSAVGRQKNRRVEIKLN